MKKYVISVIVPVFNEEKNLSTVAEKINSSLSEFGRTFEIIFVNDGSTDNSYNTLEKIRQSKPNITLVNLIKNKGKAAALEQGFKHALGDCIVVIDSDLQYEPKDIPLLIQEIEKGADVVSVQRVVRSDSASTIKFSKLHNKLLKLISGVQLDDYFSGLKCFRKEVLDTLKVTGNLIRFISVLAVHEGFNVVEIPLKHYERIHGSSRYSFMKRVLLAFSDIRVLLTRNIKKYF